MKKFWLNLLLCSTVSIIGIYCKKDNVPDKSAKLILLQNEWTPISSWIFLPSGNKYQLLPFLSVNFTSDFKENDYYYVATPTLKIEYSTSVYQLLPDDSTLLFYPIINGVQSAKSDTSIIKILTNHLLVYNSINKKFIWGTDSLKR